MIGGECHPTLGICICFTGSTGAQCQAKGNQTYDVIEGQLTDGRLAGIIIGWIIGVPICIAFVSFWILLIRIDILYAIQILRRWIKEWQE